MSPRTEQVSIYLRYISGGVTKETFIGYSLRPSKIGTAIVYYFFFSLAGPREKQVMFAIRAKLGLTPPPKWVLARTPMLADARYQICLRSCNTHGNRLYSCYVKVFHVRCVTKRLEEKQILNIQFTTMPFVHTIQWCHVLLTMCTSGESHVPLTMCTSGESVAVTN